MSIWVIEGLPRHGKSTFATMLVLEWQAYYMRRRREPRKLIANFEIHLPDVQYVETFDDMRDIANAVVVIDEAAEWFGCHSSKDNAKFMRFFRQHGKQANTLYLIAHSYADLDVTIRERTCEGIWRVKRLFGPTRWEEPSIIEQVFGWWAYAVCYQARDYGTSTKRVRLGHRFIRIDRLHGMFDTLCKVGDKSGQGAGRGAGLAQAAGVQAQPRAPRRTILQTLTALYHALEDRLDYRPVFAGVNADRHGLARAEDHTGKVFYKRLDFDD